MTAEKKKRRGLRRVLGCGCLVLAVAGAALAALALGARVYHDLLRERIRVEQAWAGVEAAFERRLQLAPELERTLRSDLAIPEDRLRALEVARERARRSIPTPELLNRPDELRAYERAQWELGDAIVDALQEVDDAAIGDLAARIESNEERLGNGARALAEAVDSYNEAIDGRVARLLAGPLDFRPKTPLDPTFYNAAAPDGAEKGGRGP